MLSVRLRLVLALLTIAALTTATRPSALADEVCPPFFKSTGATVPDTPRVRRATLGGVPYNVLLPDDYATSGARYPVLYLLNSFIEDEDEYLALTDLVEFTAGEPVIIVLPYGGTAGWYSDWVDGSAAWESFHIGQLLPHIDSTYRTLADRSHRAVAGFSLGGFGAMSYAARHPDAFSVAATFSGVVDTMTLRGQILGGSVQGPCDLRPPFSVWGDPLTSGPVWRAHNPTDLAANLSGFSLYLAARNGLPCPDDPTPEPALEPMVREMTENFSAALTRAGVAHTLHLEACGGHFYNYVQADIHRFWPQMRAAFAGS